MAARTFLARTSRFAFSTSSKEPRNNRWSEDVWNLFRKYLNYKLRFGVLCVTLAGSATYFAWLRESESGVTNEMIMKFEKGTQLLMWDQMDMNANVQRAEIHSYLKQLLHPLKISTYGIVVGEKGTGKSTAIRQVIRSIPEPKGVAYMMVPTSGSPTCFVQELEETIGYRKPFSILDRLRTYLHGATRTHTPATWDEMIKKFLAVAFAYKAKYGRPLVFVVDDVDLIAHKSPDLLLQLQRVAKSGADSGNLRVVFASTKGAALPILMGSSQISRAADPFEISDLPDSEAVQYLESCGVPTEKAQLAVEKYAGGRFSLLGSFATSQKSLAELRQISDINVGEKLIALGLAATDKLFKELVGKTRVPKTEAIVLASQAKLEQLLKQNILSVHPDGTYSFESRPVQAFFVERVKSK